MEQNHWPSRRAKIVCCTEYYRCPQSSFVSCTIARWIIIPAGDDVPQFKGQIETAHLCQAVGLLLISTGHTLDLIPQQITKILIAFHQDQQCLMENGAI